MKIIRTELGTGRLIYDLSPEQFRERTAEALSSDFCESLALDGGWVREVPAPAASNRDERIVAFRATLIGSEDSTSEIEIVARVNILTVRNFRQPVIDNVLLRPEEEEDVDRYTYRRVPEPGYETRDRLLQRTADYLLALVSGETTMKSVVSPQKPQQDGEETAAVQIDINDGVVGVSVDIAARTCPAGDRVGAASLLPNVNLVSSTDVFIDYAVMLDLNLRNPGEVITDIERITDPDDPFRLKLMGIVDLDGGKDRRAARLFARASSLAESAPFDMSLAVISREYDRHDLAMLYAGRAIEANTPQRAIMTYIRDHWAREKRSERGIEELK